MATLLVKTNLHISKNLEYLLQSLKYFQSIHETLDKNMQRARGRHRTAYSAKCWLPQI